jgi:hypothetical protein
MHRTIPRLLFPSPFLAHSYPASVVWFNGRHRRRTRQGNQDGTLRLRDGDGWEMIDGNLVPSQFEFITLWLGLLVGLGGLGIRTQPEEGKEETRSEDSVI